MLMTVERNTFYELFDNSWSGAIQVLKEIENQGRENEAMDIIENIFIDEVPTDTQVNDFIWFELADIMGLYNEEKEEEDEEE